MFFLLNFDVWNIWGRTLGKWTILHSLGSPHWLSIFIHYLWVQSKHPVIQGSSMGTWVTCKMRDNHSSGLHNVAPDLSCSDATKLSKTLESSCLESSMNRRAWLATVHGLQRARRNWVSHTQGSLVAQTVKNLPAIREAQVPSLGWGDSLEKRRAAHFSVLAWRIPWAEEPVGQ